MPFAEVPSREGPPLRIFYVLRGNPNGPRLLMLQGFAADHHGWDSNYEGMQAATSSCNLDRVMLTF